MEKQDNFHTMSYNRCRLAKQDNVVQGSHSKLGLPVLFMPSFDILGDYFLCSTQFGGSSHSLNFDKFRDTALLG